VRAVVFAYHGIGRIGLEALLRHGFDVRGLVTHPDDAHEDVWWPSVAELAAERAIPIARRDEAGEPGLEEAVAAWAPEMLFSFYFRHMLPQSILDAAPRGGFNLHGSLLPRYRGRAPANWVLVNGESETGVTLHRMTRRPDDGAIVDQERVAIAPLETAYTLFGKLEEAARVVLDRALPALRDGAARETAQDPAQASYFGGRKPEDGRIDWSQPARRIYDLVRAVTHPYPGAFTTLAGRRLFVWWARPLDGAAGASPGTIVSVDDDGIVVAAGEGRLRLVTLQQQGSPELPAAVFAMAAKLVAGRRLGEMEIPL
jgi:UDP-4-amino-4-deoxy-L-arabinose formyltransferase/UDP-glucuronic acid dehydrogenase (UDP-4-keto-hexauronic acid decarboxylating)